MENPRGGRPRTVYTNLYEISSFQQQIMRFVDEWARQNKKPISRKQIVDQMKVGGAHEPATILALRVLLQKGYLRRAVTISNKTYYVQLRRI